MAEREVRLMKGNEAIAHAAVRAGIDGYFGYPITPQSEVIETLAQLRPWETTGMVVLQAESEVASINMLYGGGGSGKRVMTSSSSPGVALMQEGISYMAGAEIPGLIVNVQRGGPGLGTIQPSQRHLRKQLYMARNTECTHQNDNNNLEICKRLVNLRRELAQLLGYDTYADYVLKHRMATNIENVYRLLNDLLRPTNPQPSTNITSWNEWPKTWKAMILRCNPGTRLTIRTNCKCKNSTSIAKCFALISNCRR